MASDKERPITIRWRDLLGTEHTFSSTDDKVIKEKAYALFLQKIANKIRDFCIEQ